MVTGVADSDKGDSPRTRITASRLQQLESSNRLLQQQLDIAKSAAAAAAGSSAYTGIPLAAVANGLEGDEVGRLIGLLAERDAELAMLGAELAIPRAAIEAMEPGEGP